MYHCLDVSLSYKYDTTFSDSNHLQFEVILLSQRRSRYRAKEALERHYFYRKYSCMSSVQYLTWNVITTYLCSKIAFSLNNVVFKLHLHCTCLSTLIIPENRDALHLTTRQHWFLILVSSDQSKKIKEIILSLI